MVDVKKQLLSPILHQSPGLDCCSLLIGSTMRSRVGNINLDDPPVIAHMENKLNEVGPKYSPLALF